MIGWYVTGLAVIFVGCAVISMTLKVRSVLRGQGLKSCR
jgi:hypothetical protein